VRAVFRCAATTLALVLAQPVVALNLSQAYQAALQQDATLMAARAQASAGQEGVPLARAQLLPNVSASFSRNDNHLTSRTPNFLGALAQTTYDYPSKNDTVSLRQPLFRWYQWSNFQQAKFQVAEADAALNVELQNLAVRVTSAYFEALLAEDQWTLAKNQVNTFRTHVEAAKKKLLAGSGIRTDVDEAQARLDMGLARELEAQQNVEFTRQQLQVTVNQPVRQLAVLNPSALSLVRPDPDRVEDWVALAKLNSPELQTLKARVEIAQQEIEKARAGHLPTLDAVANWSRSSSENSLSVNSSYEQRALGLQLNIPLYAGGGVNASIRQAVAHKERAEHLLEATQRDLSVRVFKEFRGMTEGVLRVRALEQALRSAEQSLESSRRSFQAGSRTRLDVFDAESRRVSAMLDLSAARYFYLLSQMRLRSLVGDAGEGSVQFINQTLSH